jgi:tetratricopeptide (TPR) repeat protein
MLWATLGAIAIVVAAAGAYVWYQIRVLSPPAAPAVARRLPAPLPLPLPPTDLPPLARADPAAPTAATVTIASDPLPAPSAPSAAAGAVPRSAPAAEDPVARLLREAPAAPAAPPPLKLDRTVDRPAVPANVTSGYAALRRGELGEARRSYEAALAADAMSIDARLGMATVEARAGNRSVAQLHYRRALELDPRSATALAGLAALADGLPPEAVEAQLREDVARFPESAALRFALGSHYAAQRRWGEAQAAFYEAHRLEPAAADIVYNLAVSLDHMNQTRLAAEFYRRAVEAAQSQPTQFDPAPVRRRIAELAAR